MGNEYVCQEGDREAKGVSWSIRGPASNDRHQGKIIHNTTIRIIQIIIRIIHNTALQPARLLHNTCLRFTLSIAAAASPSCKHRALHGGRHGIERAITVCLRRLHVSGKSMSMCHKSDSPPRHHVVLQSVHSHGRAFRLLFTCTSYNVLCILILPTPYSRY